MLGLRNLALSHNLIKFDIDTLLLPRLLSQLAEGSDMYSSLFSSPCSLALFYHLKFVCSHMGKGKREANVTEGFISH